MFVGDVSKTVSLMRHGSETLPFLHDRNLQRRVVYRLRNGGLGIVQKVVVTWR